MHWVCCISQDATRKSNKKREAGHTLRAAGERAGGAISVGFPYSSTISTFPIYMTAKEKRRRDRNARKDRYELGRSTGAASKREGVAVSSDPYNPGFGSLFCLELHEGVFQCRA